MLRFGNHKEGDGCEVAMARHFLCMYRTVYIPGSIYNDEDRLGLIMTPTFKLPVLEISEQDCNVLLSKHCRL